MKQQRLSLKLGLILAVVAVPVLFLIQTRPARAPDLIRFGFCEWLERDLKGGLSPNSSIRGVCLLERAISAGRPDCVRRLLENGADPNHKTSYPHDLTMLMLAISQNEPEMVELLIEFGANINEVRGNGKNAVWVAVDRPKILDVLIDRGIDINAFDNSSQSILHWAAKNCRIDITRIALSNGAAITHEDNNGKTPLDYATINQCNQIIDLLNTKL